ncbi:MAG: hypothetical protein N3G22_02855 [Candidatus Micrarchaeota archaeon]|nr:hypothetical protein [Candidatus Micrarchaeota archaeon]
MANLEGGIEQDNLERSTEEGAAPAGNNEPVSEPMAKPLSTSILRDVFGRHAQELRAKIEENEKRILELKEQIAQAEAQISDERMKRIRQADLMRSEFSEYSSSNPDGLSEYQLKVLSSNFNKEIRKLLKGVSEEEAKKGMEFIRETEGRLSRLRHELERRQGTYQKLLMQHLEAEQKIIGVPPAAPQPSPSNVERTSAIVVKKQPAMEDSREQGNLTVGNRRAIVEGSGEEEDGSLSPAERLAQVIFGCEGKRKGKKASEPPSAAEKLARMFVGEKGSWENGEKEGENGGEFLKPESNHRIGKGNGREQGKAKPIIVVVGANSKKRDEEGAKQVKEDQSVAIEEAKYAQEPTGVSAPMLNEAIREYAELLRAKEKWRNISILSRYSQEQGKFKKAMRWLFGVRHDDKVLSRENEIRENFKSAVSYHIIEHGTSPATGLESIYSKVRDELNSEGRESFFARFLRQIRKPSVAFGRFVAGAALAGGAFLTGGISGAIMLGTAGVLGAVGRFVAVDGMWDFLHAKWSTRASKGIYGMAGTVFYNSSDSKISQNASKVFSDAEDRDAARVVEDIDNSFMKYADRMGRNRFWKRVAAVAAMAAPFIYSKYFAAPSKEAPAVASTTHDDASASGAASHDAASANQPASPQPTQAEPLPDQSTEIYTVKPGGSFWSMSREILHDKLGENFESLPKSEKNAMIDALSKRLQADAPRYGITNGELHPYGGASKPWLNLQDNFDGHQTNIKFSSKDLQEFLKDYFQNGKKLPRQFGIGAANVATSNVFNSLSGKAQLKL